MDINKMIRKQFEELDLLEDDARQIDVDSIVLLPTKIKHDSGFNMFHAVACNKF